MRLKIRTVDFLEWLLGGPYVYDGPDLFVAHASMHIDSWSVFGRALLKLRFVAFVFCFSGAVIVLRSRTFQDNLSYTQMMKLYQQVLVGIEDIDELSKQELLQVLEAQRGPVVDPYKEFETGFGNSFKLP